MARPRNPSPWRVLYVAPNEAWALMVKELLEQDGFLVMLRSAGIPHMGPSAPHELLVPEAEVHEAQERLAEALVQLPGGPGRGAAPEGEALP
ncbi:MAG: glutamate decarboxylase [Clostridia bacterium]|nr:glutamate decarboxylase [Clostridia bacterium]